MTSRHPALSTKEDSMHLLQFLRRKRPSSPQMKAPVKVTVTAVKVRADGSLGEPIEVQNVRVTPLKES